MLSSSVALAIVNLMVGVRAGVEARTSPGPLPTGKGTLVGVRLQPDLLKALDRWAKLNAVSRPEAIRRLIEHSLP